MSLSETEKIELQEAALGADRLRTDPAFQRAIIEMRKAAVEALIGLDSQDVEANRTARAEIFAIDNLCGQIASTIQRGTQAARAPKAVA